MRRPATRSSLNRAAIAGRPKWRGTRPWGAVQAVRLRVQLSPAELRPEVQPALNERGVPSWTSDPELTARERPHGPCGGRALRYQQSDVEGPHATQSNPGRVGPGRIRWDCAAAGPASRWHPTAPRPGGHPHTARCPGRQVTRLPGGRRTGSGTRSSSRPSRWRAGPGLQSSGSGGMLAHIFRPAASRAPAATARQTSLERSSRPTTATGAALAQGQGQWARRPTRRRRPAVSYPRASARQTDAARTSRR